MRVTMHPDRIRTNSLDFWLARGAIACVVGLQLLVVNDLSLGPRWLAPALELALLVPLAAAVARLQGRVRIVARDVDRAERCNIHRGSSATTQSPWTKLGEWLNCPDPPVEGTTRLQSWPAFPNTRINGLRANNIFRDRCLYNALLNALSKWFRAA